MMTLVDDLVPDELWALVEPLLPAPPRPSATIGVSAGRPPGVVRYADDFVVMVAGTRAHAEALKDEVAAVLATMGLGLSEARRGSAASTRGWTSWGGASSDTSSEEAPGATSTPTRPRRPLRPSRRRCGR